MKTNVEMKDKVIWITGGNSGMGEASAKLFVEEGAKVLLTARREDQGQALAEELGENAIFVKADSKVYDELKAAANVAVEKWGTINYLLSCAGGSEVGGIFCTDDPEQIEALFKDMKHGLDLNLWGNFYAAQIAASIMIKNEPSGHYGSRGAITFIASMASDKIWFGIPPELKGTTWGPYGYGASKAGLLGLNRDLAYRLGEVGIRVNTIKPGYIYTPMQPPEAREVADPGVKISQNFPKVGGEPDDIASLALEIFRNEFINRAHIPIDAGIKG